jgi:hypothetical protein
VLILFVLSQVFIYICPYATLAFRPIESH